MTKSYDNQMLYAYLLGSLPNEDTERLDEMTFTDPSFADQVDAAEKDLVDSYVNGELTGDMLTLFESYYLSSPKRRQNVEFARTLRELASRQSNGHSAIAVAGSEKPGIFAGIISALEGLFGGRPAFALGAAVLVVALLGIGSWFVIVGLRNQGGAQIAKTNENTAPLVNILPPPASPAPSPIENRVGNSGSNVKPETNVNQSSPSPTPKKVIDEPKPVIASITLLPPLRGGEKLPQLQVKPETTSASFNLDIEAGDYASYKVALIDQSSGKHIWQAASLKPRGNGSPSLSIKLPAKLLYSQVYSFAVSGTKQDGTSENIGDYSFRVVR